MLFDKVLMEKYSAGGARMPYCGSGGHLLGAAGFELVERVNVRLCRRHERVMVGSGSRGQIAVAIETHADLGLRVSAAGYGVNLEEIKLGVVGNRLTDRLENSIYGAVSFALRRFRLPVDQQNHIGDLRPRHTGDLFQIFKHNALAFL